MEETDVTYLQNLALKYPPRVILDELSQVYFRRLQALKEDLPPGEVVSGSIVRADRAWQKIGDLSRSTFKEDGFI